jgi:hypothetical protein
MFVVNTPKGAEKATLRVRATDSAGNAIDQTITDAWLVRA